MKPKLTDIEKKVLIKQLQQQIDKRLQFFRILSDMKTHDKRTAKTNR